MSPKADTPKPTRKRTTSKASGGFTAEERAAMRERAKEARASRNREDAERDVLAKIAEMPPQDRALAKRLHDLIKTTAPELAPRTWYGMPAYAKDGDVLCHFQPAGKFKTRYPTFGFSDKAKLDDGAMWPVAFALKEITDTEAAAIIALLKRAVS